METVQISHEAQRVAKQDSPSILVVDDEPESRMILGETLGDLGYQVIERPDGPSALMTIREGRTVNLIITDERMPNMSGLELAKTVRQERPDVPIIMVTAHADIEDHFRSRGLGVFEYINKPLKRKELAVIVKAALHSVDRPQAG